MQALQDLMCVGKAGNLVCLRGTANDLAYVRGVCGGLTESIVDETVDLPIISVPVISVTGVAFHEEAVYNKLYS